LTSLSQKELKSLTDANTKKNEGFKMVNLQPFVKRVNKKRPAEASDEFMVGKGGKWTKQEALPEWDHECTEEGKIRWKSPRFMAKTERRGAMRVKGILKRVCFLL
jgi:ribosomal protein S30